MRRQWFAVLVAVPLLLFGLAACGGSGGSSGGGASDTSSSDDPQDQAVKFAQCMRDHGVDMPDPETDDKGRVRLRVGGAGAKVDKDKVDAAMEACKKYSPIGDSGRLKDLENNPEFQEAQLHWAQCMRDHGVDVPDPGSSEQRGVVIGPGQNKEKVQAAMDACDSILRDFFGDSGPGKSGGTA
jgi:hypothetical protein